MKNILILLSLVFITILPYSLFSQIRLPKLISDGMVLQRDVETKIWGWSSANENIHIDFINNHYTTKANEIGKWEIILKKHIAGGPFKMQITGSNSITISDILLGDVWVCSGQSNMEINMERVSPLYQKEIASANNNNIRYFHVPRKYNFIEAQADLSYGKWKAVTQETITEFSAIAYFFGLELNEKYNIPIGLINNSLGGSVAECWLSEEALIDFPTHFNELQKYKNPDIINKTIASDKKKANEWNKKLNSYDLAYINSDSIWSKENINTNNWSTINIPSYWPESTNGSVWFRKDIYVPKEMCGNEAKLNLGCIVDADSVFVNGVFVGNTTYRYPPRRYTIPDTLLRVGENVLQYVLSVKLNKVVLLKTNHMN